ncbi:Asp23/Gls24 family envelope stress response protein [Blastococcus sp. TF02A-26]|uniref:Asp23/Gls24 family envelope stress response protein n=1 Tax=Blastococcus sp. TF02A-26 TaxID=2250577 RepID=UPI000DEA8283|nr:Asp23/Gls24 family envelope stress response protein [Blastococcus sp. TF02A-26]RBY79022.1 Asp23/Gls24 family envelope stress response protein [Blastococcus sp. TF02A-26]
MSTAVSATSPGASATSLPDAERALPKLGDPQERGSLTIADRVVERVAGYAVTQVEGATAAPRRILGITVGDVRPEKEAAVSARVDGHTATVQATVAIGWPASVRQVASQLRQRIREDVGHITGVEVAHIDVEVVSLSTPPTARRRVQ